MYVLKDIWSYVAHNYKIYNAQRIKKSLKDLLFLFKRSIITDIYYFEI